MALPRLVLASASPRRAELLRAAGFVFEIRPVEIDEGVRNGETPETYVRRLASEKSQAASDTVGSADLNGSGLTVLGADTAVIVDGEILGKPQDDREAAEMLRRLSGRWHEVLTGVSLRASGREAAAVERTGVQFSPLGAEDIAWYVGSGEGRDKAGAYAVQGLAARFIPRIDGSYSNVVGLPIATVFKLVQQIASDGRSGYPQQ